MPTRLWPRSRMAPEPLPCPDTPLCLCPGGGSAHNTDHVSRSDRPDAGEGSPSKATETLSQFLARVLDQLSMSAWLPSAAFVLIVGVALAIRRTLDAGDASHGPADVVARAFGRIANLGLGGAIVTIGAVVVLTMLTQAFVFEAIRILEGYWGTSARAIKYADKRCKIHAERAERLRIARAAALEDAWASADRAIRKDEDRRSREHKSARISVEGLEVLRAAIFGENPLDVGLSDEALDKAVAFPWRDFAEPSQNRRLDSIDKALRDYPKANREIPTRLGNVLRAYEDRTGARRPESFVQRVFDHLPFSMQVDHDDARNRLDLYAAMVFVLPMAGLIASGLLLPSWIYAISALVVCVIGACSSYLAAVASARAYGPILANIGAYVRKQGSPLDDELSA